MEDERKPYGVMAPSNGTAAPRPAQPGVTNDPAAGAGTISKLATSAGKSMFPGVRAVLSQSGQDIAGSTTISDAVGHTVRGAGALIPAVADDIVGQPFRQVVQPVLGGVVNAAYTAATGQPSPAMKGPISTAAAAAPPVAVAPSAPGQTPTAQAAVPAAQTAGAGPAPTAQAAAPGAIRRFVDANGRVLYTNQPGDGAMPGGAPTPGADAAAAALAARSAAQGSGLISRLAAGEQPTGPVAAVVGTQAVAERNERNARFDEEVLRGQADTAMRLQPGRRGTAAGAIYNLAADNMRKGRQDEATTASREAAETARVQEREAGATQRNRESIAGQDQREATRLAAGADLRDAQAGEAKAKSQLTISALAAQKAYSDAIASGDAKAIQQAERRLRVLAGKFDQESRVLVVPGGQTSNEFGQPITQPSMVFDQATGQFIRPDAPRPRAPAAGNVVDGYRFKGGDPADAKNWEKV